MIPRTLFVLLILGYALAFLLVMTNCRKEEGTELDQVSTSVDTGVEDKAWKELQPQPLRLIISLSES